jgi:hypothetical protein
MPEFPGRAGAPLRIVSDQQPLPPLKPEQGNRSGDDYVHVANLGRIRSDGRDVGRIGDSSFCTGSHHQGTLRPYSRRSKGADGRAPAEQKVTRVPWLAFASAMVRFAPVGDVRRPSPCAEGWHATASADLKGRDASFTRTTRADHAGAGVSGGPGGTSQT